MSLDKKRDELAKLLTCLLVSRKEACSIKELERDYYDTEGKVIPFRDFGFHSTLDFLRSISNHVTLSWQSGGDYLVYPVVSDKIKHVNDLVIRQKSSKKSTPAHRRQSRPSRYYPPVCEPKPFIPNKVQKKVAQILVENPSGVDSSSIVQCLQNSNAIARPVDHTNVNDYINGVPHIAIASRSCVYPSRSLAAMIDAEQCKKQATNGYRPVTPDPSKFPESSSRNTNASLNHAYPGGSEEGEEIYNDEDFYDEFADEDFPLESSAGNYHAVNDGYQPEGFSRTPDKNRSRLSSAEFIERVRYQEPQSQNHAFENRDMAESHNDIEVGVNGVGNNEGNYEREYIYSSEDEAVNIISSRLQLRLEQLIKKHPDGIWCANLLQVFLDEYKIPLDYAELGFASVCELAASLRKIFQLHRWNDRGDFMLYHASQPLPLSLKEPKSRSPTPVWEDESNDNDDVEPFPMTMALQVTEKLIPNDVMTLGESVGQERIPEITAAEDCIEVYVADVYTPSLFWVHLRKKRAKLRQLMNVMHEFYQTNEYKYTIPHVILEKGLNCVCMFEDTWHRAIIKTVKPDGDVTLIFYDFGTTKTYPPDRVRYLHRKFSNLPAQSIVCGLYNVKPVNSDNWTRGASLEFWTKVMDLPLMAMVVNIDRENNSMLVSLTDTQYEEDFHMNDWMVRQGLAEYGSMEAVTPDAPYSDDQVIPAQDATAELQDVPLIRPHTTMLENSETPESTLKPPPGFAKRSEPGNAAAFMDACLLGTGYNTSKLGSSNYMNFRNTNLNNNPFIAYNETFNPLIFPTEVMMELLKNRFATEFQKQMEDKLVEVCEKLVAASANSSVINGTSPNNSNTNPSTPSAKPIPQPTNPFQQESATRTNNFGASDNCLTNLSTDKSNPFSIDNDTNSADVSRLPNVDSTLSNVSAFNLQKLSSELPSPVMRESCEMTNSNPIYENMNNFDSEHYSTQNSSGTHATDFFDNKSHSTATKTSTVQLEMNGIPEKTLFNEAQFIMNLKNINNNYDLSVNNKGFANQQFHCTNPFKEDTAQNFTDSAEPQKEQDTKIKAAKYNSDNRPPIPPRNPNLINKNLNLTSRNRTHVKPAEMPTVPKEIPTTEIYYEAKPMMYNLEKTDSTQTRGRPVEKIPKSLDTVSFRDKKDRDTTNSSQKHTNTLFISGKDDSSNHCQDSLSSTHNLQFGTIEVDSIVTSDKKFVTNHPQCLRLKISPNTYRSPPPPYTYSNSDKYPCENKSISPRYISPVISETSKAAIEEIRIIAELHFNELESELVEEQSSMTHNKIPKDLRTHNKHASSFAATNDNTVHGITAEATLCFQNTTFNESNTVNIISQKCQQDHQSTRNLKQEPVNESSSPDITHTAQFNNQEFIDREKNFSHLEQKYSKLTSSVGHEQPYNPKSTASCNSKKTGGFIFTFKTEINTGKRMATHVHDSFELDKRQNDSGHLPISYSPQASLNELNTLSKTYLNSGQNPPVTSKSDVGMENKNPKLPGAKPRNVPTNAVPPYYNQPPHNQPHLPNTTQHNASLYTHGPIQYGPGVTLTRGCYPCYTPQAMQYPGINQRGPTFRPGVPGYNPPAPNWSQTQFYSPGYAQHQYTNVPCSHQYSHFWNQYNSQMFAHKTPQQPTYRTETVQSKSELKSEFGGSRVSWRLNRAQNLSQEDKEKINTSRHEKISSDLPKIPHYNTVPLTTSTSTASMSHKTPPGLTNFHSNDTFNLQEYTLSTQLHDVSSQSPNRDMLENETENSNIETNSAQADSGSETVPTLTPKKDMEESSDKNLENLPQSTSHQSSAPRVFKPVEAYNQTIYLFNIENQGWVSTDEITQTFTSYPNRSVVLRILEQLCVEIDFMEIDRAQSPILFAQLDVTNLRLPRMPNTKKIKGSLHLTPVKSLARLMVTLRVVSDEEIRRLGEKKEPPSGSIFRELVRLITSYKINDEYWIS